MNQQLTVEEKTITAKGKEYTILKWHLLDGGILYSVQRQDSQKVLPNKWFRTLQEATKHFPNLKEFLIHPFEVIA